MVDAHDLKSCTFGCAGSIPASGTDSSSSLAPYTVGNTPTPHHHIHDYFPLHPAVLFFLILRYSNTTHPPIAQLVEQPALNRWVLGSNPSGRTCRGGGIGRRAGFRNRWGNPWRFESSPRHTHNSVTRGGCLSAHITGNAPHCAAVP